MKFVSIIILILITQFGLSQETKLTVLSKTDKQPVPNTHIKGIYQNSKKEFLVVSNLEGEITINGAKGEVVNLTLSFMGYKDLEKTINIGTDYKFFLEETSITLNNFVVTGQYSANSPEKAVQKITIIDKKKIEKMAAVNLKDVLSNEMNTRLSQDNILGSGLSLQGVSGENVKILIDGVPVVGRLNGNVDLSQINLNDIERIEIIEGPMSVSYGTNALAGVINLITKTNTKKKLTIGVNTYYENIGQYNIDGSVSYSHKKHSLSLSGGRNYFDGWIDGDQQFGELERIADSTRYKSWKPKEQYFAKGNYKYNIKNGGIKLTSAYFEEKISNRGLPKAPYGESAFDDFYYTARIDNSLNYNQKLKKDKNVKMLISYNDYKRVKNKYFRNLTNLEDVQTTNLGDQDTTKFNQWVARGTYSTSKDSAKINYELGIDLNQETATGRRIEDKTQQMGDYAMFVSLEYKPLKNTIIRPGLRYGHNTSYDAPLTPSVNVKHTIGNVNIRGSYARGFRAPSLKELYFDFVDINHNIVGNTELKAEYSNNFNLSINYTKTVKNYLLKMSFSSFYNKIDNLITLAQGAGTQFSYVNIGEYQTHGFQLNSNHSYDHMKFGIGGSYIGRFNRLSETENVSMFSYTPELKATFNYEFPKQKMFVAVFYKFTGKLPNFRLDQNGAVTQSYLGAYNTADLSIGKKFLDKKLQVTVGSKNLFDVKNISSFTSGGAHSGGGSGGSPVAMGRTYFVKLAFNFDVNKKNKK